MSEEHVIGFLEKVRREPELMRRLERIGKGYKGDKQNLRVIIANNILPTAQANGYSFTLQEYQEYIKKCYRNQKEEGIAGLGLHVLFPGVEVDGRRQI